MQAYGCIFVAFVIMGFYILIINLIIDSVGIRPSLLANLVFIAIFWIIASIYGIFSDKLPLLYTTIVMFSNFAMFFPIKKFCVWYCTKYNLLKKREFYTYPNR